jgi:group I intron endonuclease
MIIYKLTNKLNQKVYIGQTRRTLEARISEHIRDANARRGYYISNAISKYGIESFKIEILAETEDADALNYLEEYYIRKYNSVDHGYNLSYGGNSNTMDCAVTRNKHDAVMRSPEVRAKISSTLKKQISENGLASQYAERMHKGFREYLKTDKFKQDCANRHLTPEHFKALNDAKNKKVRCYNELGEVVKSFDRVKDAAIWWLENGYSVKNYGQLMDKIKQSDREHKYFKGLLWEYYV